MLINPSEREAALDTQLVVEGALDPRSAEFLQAVKLTPATLHHYRTKGRWMPAEHLLFVSSIIATEVVRGDARIIVEVPPRHGKSELISVATPIWFLEHFPWAHVILTTYAADLAERFGRRVRDALLDPSESILSVRVRDDVQRTDIFLTTEEGGMQSVGIGGPITGSGAHLLIVDDYIKNWAEATSQQVLESIRNWFTSTAYTRLEPGGSCIILATRWAVDDLIGWLKSQDDGSMWTIIRLPAIAEENDPLNRKPGEALWKERYPFERLRSIKTVVGNFIFNALYQQNPGTQGSAKADPEMIRLVDAIPNPQLFRWVRSWDLAATDAKRKKGDWSVGTLIGTDGSPGSPVCTTAIADMIRERWRPSQVEINVRTTAEADGFNVPILIEQEPGASGKSYAQHLATNVLRGYNVVILPPGGINKFIRAQPYIAAVDHGRIMALRATWNKQHKKELEEFPNGKFDDTIDSAGQGYNYLHQNSLLIPTWGRESSEESRVVRANQDQLVTGVTWGRGAGGQQGESSALLLPVSFR